MSPQNPIRLTSDDLFSPKVEGYLEEQAVLRRAVPEAPPQPLVLRILYSSVFYLSVASAIGALAAWAITEPFIVEGVAQESEDDFEIINILLFPTVASFVGLFLGAAEGIMCRNARRAATSAAVGLGMGFVGGLVALFPAIIIYGISIAMAVQLDPPTSDTDMPSGFALLLMMMGRAAAWSVAAIPAGIGQGIALRERKVVINGLLGAAIGGLIGGLVFDPIYLLLGTPERAVASRAVGFAVIGIMVGLFVGLVEQWTKTAWLLMRAGPLAGKQFILHKNPTVIGSSPKADIYIFKDAAIEPQHALIHNRGGRFEIEDCNTGDGTYVNGVPVKRQMLKVGDKVVVGRAVLEFAVKET
jgi:hypothetical protein